MTRTLRVVTRLNIGGPAVNVTLADAGLRARGYDTLLVYGRLDAGEGSAEALVSAHALPCRVVPSLGRRVALRQDLATWRALVRCIAEWQPAIVHTHTSKAGALGRLAGAWHNLGRSRRDRCRLVHTFDGHVFEGYFGTLGSRAIVVIERLLARCTDVIVVVAPRQKHDLVERFRIAPSARVVVVPHGLDLAPYLDVPVVDPEARRGLGLPMDAFVALFVGRLVPIKDVPTLLEAFARHRCDVPSARLLVAGDGELGDALKARAVALGLDDAVHWLGWRRDLTQLYGASDVVVLSSRNEGTPLALIEGMAAGRPAVATAVGGVADVVRDGTTGLLVAPGDVGALAEALTRLARDAAHRRAMGQAARDDVRVRYSAARLADDLDRLYRSLLDGVTQLASPPSRPDARHL